MVTHGRRIYPTNLVERRLLLSLGSNPLYVPRGLNPFVIARRLTRAAKAEQAEVAFIRAQLQGQRTGAQRVSTQPPNTQPEAAHVTCAVEG